MSNVTNPEFSRAFIDQRQPFPYLDLNEFDYAKPKDAFDVLGAQAWIDMFRFPTTGALDMYEMSKRIGVELVTDVEGVSLGSANWTLEPDNPVVIFLGKSRDEHRVTFGHEVCHAFLNESRGLLEVEQITSDGVERVCDYFGEATAMPLRDFQGIEKPTAKDIVELSREYQVTPKDVLSRLETLGKIPKRTLILSKIRRTGGVLTSVFCGPCRWEYDSCNDLSLPVHELDFTPFDVFAGGGCGGDWKRRNSN